jgi:two-component system sensor histidine kinase YesM
MIRLADKSGFFQYTFRKKLIVSYIVIVLIPVLIMMFLYFPTGSKIIEKLTIELFERSKEQTGSYLTGKLELESVIANLLTVNNEVFTILSSSTDSYPLSNQLDDAKKLEQFVKNVLDRNGEIHKIKLYVDEKLIFANENTVIFNLNSIDDLSWLQNTRDKNGKLHWVVKSSAGVSVLSASRYIKNFRGLDGSDVLVEVQMKSEMIRKIISDGMISDKGSYVLANDESAILFSSSSDIDKSWNSESMLNLKDDAFPHYYLDSFGNKLIVIQKKIDFLNWQLFFIIPIKEILKQNDIFQKYSIVVLVIVSLIILSLAYYISGYNAKRIERLYTKMDTIINGNLNVKLVSKSNDEIGKLEKQFNYMVVSIKEHLEKEIAMNREVKNAEMKALQSQINPHFLYNTLELINWLIDLNQNSQAYNLVLSLASFYKISLGKGEDMITIREELEHVNMYVAIQNMRFDNRIRLTMDIDQTVLDYKISKILLQPIVENSIIHGISHKDNKEGLIVIICRNLGEFIEFIVKDDGVGIHAEKLNRIRESDRANTGYGIRSVRERILLYYGPECDLQVESTPGIGTTLRFRIIPINFRA